MIWRQRRRRITQDLIADRQKEQFAINIYWPVSQKQENKGSGGGIFQFSRFLHQETAAKVSPNCNVN